MGEATKEERKAELDKYFALERLLDIHNEGVDRLIRLKKVVIGGYTFKIKGHDGQDILSPTVQVHMPDGSPLCTFKYLFKDRGVSHSADAMGICNMETAKLTNDNKRQLMATHTEIKTIMQGKIRHDSFAGLMMAEPINTHKMSMLLAGIFYSHYRAIQYYLGAKGLIRKEERPTGEEGRKEMIAFGAFGATIFNSAVPTMQQFAYPTAKLLTFRAFTFTVYHESTRKEAIARQYNKLREMGVEKPLSHGLILPYKTNLNLTAVTFAQCLALYE